MALVVAAGATAATLFGWEQHELSQPRRLGLLAFGAALWLAALWVALAQEAFYFGQGAAEREWRFVGFHFIRRLPGVSSITSGRRLRRGGAVWRLHLHGRDGTKVFLESELAGSKRIDALAEWLKATCGVQNVLGPFKPY